MNCLPFTWVFLVLTLAYPSRCCFPSCFSISVMSEDRLRSISVPSTHLARLLGSTEHLYASLSVAKRVQSFPTVAIATLPHSTPRLFAGPVPSAAGTGWIWGWASSMFTALYLRTAAVQLRYIYLLAFGGWVETRCLNEWSHRKGFETVPLPTFMRF